MWSKVKALLRSLEARTPADLVRDRIGQALSPSDGPRCAPGWFVFMWLQFLLKRSNWKFGAAATATGIFVK